MELSEGDTPLSAAPHVSWFFQSNSNNFVALDDSVFWEREYNKYYCGKTAFPFPDFRDYSGPSHFDCIHSGSEGDTTSYNCSMEYRKCFLGTYKCSVSLAGGTEIVKEVTTRVISKFVAGDLDDPSYKQGRKSKSRLASRDNYSRAPA